MLSSDAIRDSLPLWQQGGSHVFERMARELATAVTNGAPIVLDSTGMSPRFQHLLRAHRTELFHVHLVLGSVECFERRERVRTDRKNGSVPHSAFFHSAEVVFRNAPDLTIVTDNLSTDDVYRITTQAIRFRFAHSARDR